MSYILDALKKSDRERQSQAVSSLARPQSEFHARQGEGPRGAVWLMAGSLVIASGVVGALIAMNWHAAQDAPDIAAVEAPATAVAEASAPTDAGTGIEAVATPMAATVAPADTAVEDITAPATGLVEIWELTEAEQRYLGALEVSLHVHSSEPAQRTVIVNGLRAKEGQSLGQDIRLLEITPDGLIVEFRGRHVHLATVNAS